MPFALKRTAVVAAAVVAAASCPQENVSAVQVRKQKVIGFVRGLFAQKPAEPVETEAERAAKGLDASREAAMKERDALGELFKSKEMEVKQEEQKLTEITKELATEEGIQERIKTMHLEKLKAFFGQSKEEQKKKVIDELAALQKKLEVEEQKFQEASDEYDTQTKPKVTKNQSKSSAMRAFTKLSQAVHTAEQKRDETQDQIREKKKLIAQLDKFISPKFAETQKMTAFLFEAMLKRFEQQLKETEKEVVKRELTEKISAIIAEIVEPIVGKASELKRDIPIKSGNREKVIYKLPFVGGFMQTIINELAQIEGGNESATQLALKHLNENRNLQRKSLPDITEYAAHMYCQTAGC